jgi:NAD(P)-dependent dehydrogenase (short-subunit alcohol dehydrogenase family)
MSDVYVISGASRGIGLELTRQLLDQGHQVFAGVRTPNKATDLLALAQASGDRLSVLELDVSSTESVRRFADAVSADHVDVLLNNAGVYLDGDAELGQVPPETVLESLNVNSVGPLRMAQTFLEKLHRAKRPKVASITSLMGSIADNQGGGSVAYRMSKTALNMFTKTLSIDEPGFVVLSLHPGWVKTSMGGPNAPVSVERSAQGLLSVIQKASKENSGHFYNFDGRELPW